MSAVPSVSRFLSDWAFVILTSAIAVEARLNVEFGAKKKLSSSKSCGKL